MKKSIFWWKRMGPPHIATKSPFCMVMVFGFKKLGMGQPPPPLVGTKPQLSMKIRFQGSKVDFRTLDYTLKIPTFNSSSPGQAPASTRGYSLLGFWNYYSYPTRKILLLGRVASSTYRPPFSNNSNIQKVEMWHFCNVNHPKQQKNHIHCKIDQIK